MFLWYWPNNPASIRYSITHCFALLKENYIRVNHLCHYEYSINIELLIMGTMATNMHINGCHDNHGCTRIRTVLSDRKWNIIIFPFLILVSVVVKGGLLGPHEAWGVTSGSGGHIGYGHFRSTIVYDVISGSVAILDFQSFFINMFSKMAGLKWRHTRWRTGSDVIQDGCQKQKSCLMPHRGPEKLSLW